MKPCIVSILASSLLLLTACTRLHKDPREWFRESKTSHRYRIPASIVGSRLDLGAYFSGLPPKSGEIILPEGWHLASVPRNPALDPPFPDFYHNYILLENTHGNAWIALHPRKDPDPDSGHIKGDDGIVQFPSYIFDVFPSPPKPHITRVDSIKCADGGSRSVFQRSGCLYFGGMATFFTGVKVADGIGVGISLALDSNKGRDEAIDALKAIAAQFPVLE